MSEISSSKSNFRNLGGLVVLALYVLVSLPMVFTGSILFYDEWVYLSDPRQISPLARACPVDLCKSPFLHYGYPLLVEHGVVLLRISVVLSWLVSAILLGKILKLTPGLSEFQRSATVQVFLLIPIFGARIAMSEYVFEVLIFLCGAFLIANRGAPNMVLGCIVVTFAAFFPSLQLFGLAIAFVLASQDFHQLKRLSRATLICTLVMLLQPVVHRVILQDLLVEIGEKSPAIGYNPFSFKYAIRALTVGMTLMGPLTIQLIRHIRSRSRFVDFRPSLIAVGLSVLALGTVPYIAVGHFPTITDWVMPSLPDAGDWNSRHQLLQGFGYSLLIGGLLSALLPTFRRGGLLFVLLLCALLTFSTNIGYYLDSRKQADFIDQVRDSEPSLRLSSHFVVVDSATDFNARRRVLRSYEWEGMLRLALERPITMVDLNRLELLATCPVRRQVTLLTVKQQAGRLKVLVSGARSIQVDISDANFCI